MRKAAVFLVSSAAIAVGLGVVASTATAYLAPTWQASPAVLVGAVTTIVVAVLELGAGIRHLLSGVMRDLVEVQKARLEIERIGEELKNLRSRVHLPTSEEVAEIVQYQRGEFLRPTKTWEREKKF